MPLAVLYAATTSARARIRIPASSIPIPASCRSCQGTPPLRIPRTHRVPHPVPKAGGGGRMHDHRRGFFRSGNVHPRSAHPGTAHPGTAHPGTAKLRFASMAPPAFTTSISVSTPTRPLPSGRYQNHPARPVSHHARPQTSEHARLVVPIHFHYHKRRYSVGSMAHPKKLSERLGHDHCRDGSCDRKHACAVRSKAANRATRRKGVTK